MRSELVAAEAAMLLESAEADLHPANDAEGPTGGCPGPGTLQVCSCLHHRMGTTASAGDVEGPTKRCRGQPSLSRSLLTLKTGSHAKHGQQMAIKAAQHCRGLHLHSHQRCIGSADAGLSQIADLLLLAATLPRMHSTRCASTAQTDALHLQMERVWGHCGCQSATTTRCCCGHLLLQDRVARKIPAKHTLQRHACSNAMGNRG